MCGEYVYSLAIGRYQCRFTPTCVGNTTSRSPDQRRSSGSPPRVWGIRHRRKPAASSSRFTPTCVGNTVRAMRWRDHYAVHPHVCGEYCSSYAATCDSRGSPPRVWGIRRRSLVSLDRARFTPTCVGNTLAGHSTPCTPPVHPHVCGEYRLGIVDSSRRLPGSPPRVWGIRLASRRSTMPALGSPPRVWGIPARNCVRCSSSTGSPPRVWGIQRRSRHATAASRFTPTCVGNTLCAHATNRQTRFTPTCVGNTVLAPSRTIASCRFTPTCVGNTHARDQHMRT